MEFIELAKKAIAMYAMYVISHPIPSDTEKKTNQRNNSNFMLSKSFYSFCHLKKMIFSFEFHFVFVLHRYKNYKRFDDCFIVFL